jgi:selenocysteine lyase/cysteine desulfurase
MATRVGLHAGHNEKGKKMALTPVARLRSETVGIDVPVPLLVGGTRPYVNLDNASSTPTFRPIVEKVDEFLAYYSNVGRGTGFKSEVATWALGESRLTIGRFLGADPDADTVIFTRNTTESMNRLAALFPFQPDSVVLTTLMEHHSNDLPWRRRARVVHAGIRPDGSLDLDDFAAKLKEHRGKVALVAVTGASNVTGWVNPIHQLARLAHEAGARIAVDAAQMAPHRPIDMRSHDDPEHLDFVAFSGHKTYAPYGIGILAGRKDLLRPAEPSLVGGGVVDLVTLNSVVWRGLPGREEAGTPAVVGAVAMAAAIKVLDSVGWVAVARHENALTEYALSRLSRIPGLHVYGKTRADGPGDRIGVIALSMADKPDPLVGAVLAYEAGVGARCGLFCAHPYVFALLGLGERDTATACENASCGRIAGLPGVVRVSFGLYNDESDVDALCDSLEAISRGEHAAYDSDPKTGECWPKGRPRLNPADYFNLTPRLPA